MHIRTFFFLYLLVSVNGFAQTENLVSKDSVPQNPKPIPQLVKQTPWKNHLNVSVLANQTAFNNDWQGGGTSNLAVNNKLEYKVNYKKGMWAFDNVIRMAYGITKLADEERVRKTDDNIEINNTLFRNFQNSYWSYSLLFNFKSQFAEGFKYKKDKSRDLISSRLSPAYFQLGPGFLYKKSENLNVNITPAATRLIIVDPFFTKEKDNFGVEKGKAQNVEFGASLVANYKFVLAKNVTVENLLNLYSNYLGNLANIDLNYTFNMDSKINEYMTANISFQTIYDDDTTGAFQVREMIAVGLNYTL